MGAFTDIIAAINAEMISILAERSPAEIAKTIYLGASKLSEHASEEHFVCVPTASDYGPPRFNSSQAKVLFRRRFVCDFYCFGESIDRCLVMSEDLIEALNSLYPGNFSLVGDRWPSQDEKAQLMNAKELCIVQVGFGFHIYGRAYQTVTVNNVGHTESPTPDPGELTCKP